MRRRIVISNLKGKKRSCRVIPYLDRLACKIDGETSADGSEQYLSGMKVLVVACMISDFHPHKHCTLICF